MNILPDELLIRVLVEAQTGLDVRRLAAVSRRFYAAVNTSTFWHQYPGDAEVHNLISSGHVLGLAAALHLRRIDLPCRWRPSLHLPSLLMIEVASTPHSLMRLASRTDLARLQAEGAQIRKTFSPLSLLYPRLRSLTLHTLNQPLPPQLDLLNVDALCPRNLSRPSGLKHLYVRTGPLPTAVSLNAAFPDLRCLSHNTYTLASATNLVQLMVARPGLQVMVSGPHILRLRKVPPLRFVFVNFGVNLNNLDVKDLRRWLAVHRVDFLTAAFKGAFIPLDLSRVACADLTFHRYTLDTVTLVENPSLQQALHLPPMQDVCTVGRWRHTASSLGRRTFLQNWKRHPRPYDFLILCETSSSPQQGPLAGVAFDIGR